MPESTSTIVCHEPGTPSCVDMITQIPSTITHISLDMWSILPPLDYHDKFSADFVRVLYKTIEHIPRRADYGLFIHLGELAEDPHPALRLQMRLQAF